MAARPELLDTAPLFEPHITLLGGIQGRSKEDVLALTEELASSSTIAPFQITFDRVACGDIFHQCLFILCEKTEALLAANAAARRAFNVDASAPDYMPHLSLLYSDIDISTRNALVEEEQSRLFNNKESFLGTEGSGFCADSIAVWYTPGEDKTLESWRVVAVYPLTGAA